MILTHAYPVPDALCDLGNATEYWHSASCSRISCSDDEHTLTRWSR